MWFKNLLDLEIRITIEEVCAQANPEEKILLLHQAVFLVAVIYKCLCCQIDLRIDEITSARFHVDERCLHTLQEIISICFIKIRSDQKIRYENIAAVVLI